MNALIDQVVEERHVKIETLQAQIRASLASGASPDSRASLIKSMVMSINTVKEMLLHVSMDELRKSYYQTMVKEWENQYNIRVDSEEYKQLLERQQRARENRAKRRRKSE